MIGSHIARRAAMSPTGGGVASAIAPAIGASASAISGSKLNDVASSFLEFSRCWRTGTSGAGREYDDLAGQFARGGSHVDGGQFGQRHPLGDVDAQLAAVDQCHQ